MGSRRSQARIRPRRERPRLGRGDIWRGTALALLGVIVAAATARVVTSADSDPVADAGRARSHLAGTLAAELRPVFGELHSQVARLAAGAGSGSALPAPADATLPRRFWITDAGGTVVAAGPSASALLGRQRPVRERSLVLAGRVVVGHVVRDPLLGATVLLLHARAGQGRVLTAAVVAATVGVQTLPMRQDNGRVALLGSDRTVAGVQGREPADGSLSGAIAAAKGSADQVVRYRGEGQVPRLAAVAVVGDGWTVVADGPVPGDGGAALRTTTTLALAALALLATLAALLLGLGAVRRTAYRAEAVQHALLTVTGHELRTPLTIIIGSTRTLTSRWDRLADPQRKELASAVGRQARQLDRLVERLLHAGRLAAGQSSDLSLVATDLVAVATGVLDDARRLSPLHDFRLDAAASTPAAAADERGLTQVLEHLVDNAVKYSPDGGAVLVEVHPEGRLNKRVRLSVSDEGVGLPSDTSRLFRPFGQSQDVNTRTTDEGGVGVGLSIVKDLVTAMGGTVHAERRTLGSTFVVVLPATST